jgi:predicted nucleic acid-binding protein
MGSLIVPAAGLVYLDTNPIIYSVEKHPVYWPLLQPLWQATKGKTIEIVSSDLTLMETLTGPLKLGDAGLVRAYEQLFQQAQTRLLPVTHAILRDAGQLRATTTKLKTPDALHAATAQQAGCVLFVTNDAGFRRVATLPSLVILDDLPIP